MSATTALIIEQLDDLQNGLAPDEFEDIARDLIIELQGRIERPRERDHDN